MTATARTLHTELMLNSHDFEEYVYVDAPGAEITFTIKELKVCVTHIRFYFSLVY